MNFPEIVSRYSLINRRRQEAIYRFLNRTHVLFLEAYKIGVGDFLCDDPTLKEDVINCSTHLKIYYERAQKDAVRPYNILFAAPPGAGKSFLAKSLAIATLDRKEGEKNFRPFNLSQLESLDDLKRVFIDIQRQSNQSTLHFFLLDDCDSFFKFPLFQKLIMPIWDGKFVLSGQERQLPSCVLLFAVSIHHRDRAFSRIWRRVRAIWKSQSLKALQSQDLRDIWREDRKRYVYRYFSKLPKGLDFLSRIHDFLLIPSLTDDIGEDRGSGDLPSRDMDKILLLVHFVLKYFKITKIKKAVLYFLASLEDERLSVRDLENIIFKSSPPQSNQFKGNNLPPEYIERFKYTVRTISEFDHSTFLHVYNEFKDFEADCEEVYKQNDGFKQAFTALPESVKFGVLHKLFSLKSRNTKLNQWLNETYGSLVEKAGRNFVTDGMRNGA